MSWSVIVSALKSRIAAVVDPGIVHDRIRWTDEATSHDSWEGTFVESTNDRIHFWEITRTSYEESQHPDADDVVIARHSVQMTSAHSHLDNPDFDPSDTGFEGVFQDLIDLVEADFRNGDRTLGGAALTHGLPEFTRISLGEAGGPMIHFSQAQFEVEEQFVLTVSGTPGTNPGDGGVQESEFLAVGQAVLDFLEPSVKGPLGLAEYGWRHEIVDDPSYPALPYTRLPKAVLRAVDSNSNAQTVGRGRSNVLYNYTLWYYSRQVPGEDHQEKLLRAVKKIVDPLAAEGYSPVLGVPGFTSEEVTVLESISAELRHDLADPNLRISVAGVAISITGQTVAC